MIIIISTIICAFLIVLSLIKSNKEYKKAMKRKIDNTEKIMEMRNNYVKNEKNDISIKKKN